MDNSKVVIRMQGEDMEGNVLDKIMDGSHCTAIVVTEEGVHVSAFGNINTIEAAHLLHALEDEANRIKEVFPFAETVLKMADLLGDEFEKTEADINE